MNIDNILYIIMYSIYTYTYDTYHKTNEKYEVFM